MVSSIYGNIRLPRPFHTAFFASVEISMGRPGHEAEVDRVFVFIARGSYVTRSLILLAIVF